jgi:hypothetical protein
VLTFSHLNLHYHRQQHWCKLNRFCMLNSAVFRVGTHSIQCNNGIVLGFQYNWNLNICMVSDYNTNPWSTNIKLDNLWASCKKELNHPSTRFGALLPCTWTMDTQKCQQHWQAYSNHATYIIYSHEMLEIICIIRQMRHKSASQQQFNRFFFFFGGGRQNWRYIILHQS